MSRVTVFPPPVLLAASLLLLLHVPREASALDPARVRQMILEMKERERGPFEGIRWFCPDGSIQPARRGCRGHGPGDGIQHGLWSEETKMLRQAGYPIATVYADIDSKIVSKLLHEPRAIAPLVLERYLILRDDGWIFRKARQYRGALQVEDEIAGANRLLQVLSHDERWLEDHYLLFRDAARLMPRTGAGPGVSEIRAMASRLADQHSGFRSMRNKLHISMDAEDSRRVREFAAGLRPAQAAQFNLLAAKIDAAFAPDNAQVLLARSAGTLPGEGRKELRELRIKISKERSAIEQYRQFGTALLLIRKYGSKSSDPLAMADAGLSLEQTMFIGGRRLKDHLPNMSREELIELLDGTVDALFGIGLLSFRENRAAKASLARLQSNEPTAAEYHHELNYLGRVPGWAAGHLEWEFQPAIEKFASFEPLARELIPDRLRSSPLLFYSEILEVLGDDASQLMGVHHRFFERSLSSGLRALNPGLARGILGVPGRGGRPSEKIVVVPQTIAELPPVAGILTSQEGNSLSHVQLLARNLGIPNVVVQGHLVRAIERRMGKQIVLAVSPAGRVELAADGPRWNAVFAERDRAQKSRITPDLAKLDLQSRQFVPLSELREWDSGRTVGPKAANLGELMHHYPRAVAQGVVIPFGIYHSLLQQRLPRENSTIFEWMKAQYRIMERLPPDRREEFTRRFLERMRSIIDRVQLSAAFQQRLRGALRTHLGMEGTYGVFVRSDTNVEDLPGFTGAGLNLTVPHVMRFEDILQAIKDVWASPFTERAFSWRQAIMDGPEHVYCSVLLMKSVPVDKSGVLVTADINTGSPDYLTVAANRGVGGVVSNEAAETLLVSRQDGTVTLLSTASAPFARVLSPRGGVSKRPTTSTERVLTEKELVELYKFAKKLPESFPPVLDENNQPAPADVEFGFVNGRLVLFQIRPFLTDPSAKRQAYLQKMDRDDSARSERKVDLDEKPKK